MPRSAWIGRKNTARKKMLIPLWYRCPKAAEAIPCIKVAEREWGHLRGFIYSEDMNLTALVMVNIRIALAIGEIQSAAISKVEPFTGFLPLTQFYGEFKAERTYMIGLKIGVRLTEEITLDPRHP